MLESLFRDYSRFRGKEGVGQDGATREIPEFAPAAELAGNPNGLAGARLLCLAEGRQTHFVAETLLRRAKSGDSITFFAYSFDHPIVTAEIVEAVKPRS